MTGFEYKVIPAPTKGRKAQGVKTLEGRFALTVEETLNAQAAEGWEYLRSDILPSDERQGLKSTQTVYRTLLVFRRATAGDHDPADDVMTTAQTVAESVTPESAAPSRREPTVTPVEPTRGDPAPTPGKPDPDSPKKE